LAVYMYMLEERRDKTALTRVENFSFTAFFFKSRSIQINLDLSDEIDPVRSFLVVVGSRDGRS